MKTYFRILSFAKPFGKNIPLYLICTVFYIVFSMVNFSVLIPLLEVLFNQIKQTANSNNKSTFISEKTEIKSEGFKILEKGDIIIFNGNSKIILSK